MIKKKERRKVLLLSVWSGSRIPRAAGEGVKGGGRGEGKGGRKKKKKRKKRLLFLFHPFITPAAGERTEGGRKKGKDPVFHF